MANDIPALTSTHPSIQIFEHSKLVWQSSKESAEILGEGTVSFPVNVSISGDVLIRSRQPSSELKGAKMVSHFRVNLHTAFMSSDLLRLSKSELDGPHREDTWPGTLFIDLIFDQMHEGVVTPTHTAQPPEETPEDPTAPSLWQIARNEKAAHECSASELVSGGTDAEEKDYEPYEPYTSRRSSFAEDDGFEDEIEAAELTDEDDTPTGERAASSNPLMILFSCCRVGTG